MVLTLGQGKAQPLSRRAFAPSQLFDFVLLVGWDTRWLVCWIIEPFLRYLDGSGFLFGGLDGGGYRKGRIGWWSGPALDRSLRLPDD